MQIKPKFYHRGFHIANLNVRHLKPKLDDIKIMTYEFDTIDILGLCETCLNKTSTIKQSISMGIKSNEKTEIQLHLCLQTLVVVSLCTSPIISIMSEDMILKPMMLSQSGSK